MAEFWDIYDKDRNLTGRIHRRGTRWHDGEFGLVVCVWVYDGKGKLLAGFSVQKFDCSSLVPYIFYKGANKLLDVTTRTQIKQGKYVKVSDLQRGDCIFFTNAERQYNTGIERVGHVALYLGNNYILHTASDYACIEQISAKRWSYYIEARRFL